jgi:hypothetical protein
MSIRNEKSHSLLDSVSSLARSPVDLLHPYPAEKMLAWPVATAREMCETTILRCWSVWFERSGLKRPALLSGDVIGRVE